jgi:flagellar hook-associated protein 1 FlgK
MTALSTLQIAKNALFASQAGIQVAANNIANADTPGYVREKLVQAPGPTQRIGGIATGTGVQVLGVVREVDRFLQERLWSASSDLGNGDVQEKVYLELEAAIGELTDSDISTAMTEFFNSINDVLNQPEDPAVRNLAILRGDGLASQLRSLDSRVQDLREMANERILNAATEVNKLVTEVATLNMQIIEIEQGGAIVSDAVGLRDKRDKALGELAQLVNIHVEEQATGAVNVFVGGDYLVFDGATQLLKPVTVVNHGLAAAELRLSKSDATLRATSGELAGLLTARDDILLGFIDQLDTFTGTMIFEFNKLHTSGQGLSGYTEMLSEQRIENSNLPLDESGLPFTPVHGSFQVHVVNKETGATQTHDVFVRLNGLDDDTTFAGLAQKLDIIGGLSATITLEGQLQLESESEDLEFVFGNDSSGVLAALGLGTFFTGTTAEDIRVHAALLEDAGKLAMSHGGVGVDTENGELLANLLTTPLVTRDNNSLAQLYDRWMGETSQASSLSRSVAEGYRSFQSTLEGEHLGLSGVSLDEEAINMMTYQRTFQAAAKVITTISEMLDILVQL